MNGGQVQTQLHLGLGSFHRAHQAVYMQDLHEQGDERWQIVAGNIRPDMQELIDVLIAQEGAYTLETVSPAGERHYQRVNAIRQVIPFDTSLVGLTRIAADPATRIISFTVTEAGYYLDGNNQLDDSFEDLRSDLNRDTHQTLYGALSIMLMARRKANGGAITLLNCDNLRSNGERFYAGFQGFLEQRGEHKLLDWVRNNTTAPNCMVDRITPRPTPDIQERVKAATGQDDPAALMGETFTQWVIEDNFIAGRPDWERVGVEMVADVLPYEEAKIRLLNATHTCIAWAGILRGYTYIHEDCADPLIVQLAYNYVTYDAIPCLDTPRLPSPIDLEQYRDIVLKRFANPHILDTNQRVAMDAFSKIPSQIVPTIRECLKAGRPIDNVVMLPVLFLAVLLRHEQGTLPFSYQDQGMPESSVQRICSADDVVAAYVNERLLFDDLTGDARVLEKMRVAWRRMLDSRMEVHNGKAAKSSKKTDPRAGTGISAESRAGL